MALLTPAQIGMNTTITPDAASASNTAVADDRAWFEVTVGATATTLTLVVPGTAYGQARADVIATSVSNTTRRFGPLVPDLATDGVVELTCSQTTAVTIKLVRI
jgi:hypothetical protein